MFRFETPWALLLLLCPLLLLLFRHAKKPAIAFSSLEVLRKSGKSLRVRLSWLPRACGILAWCLVVIALARPQAGAERINDTTEGIAIEMVLDKSSSMTQDMSRGSNRFETVKRVFTDFVYGDGKHLEGRPNDLIGFITFARYADTICPLTLSHDTIRPLIESAQIVTLESEDGTAIGDALALAAARLKTAEETLAAQARKQPDAFHISSKVIILLTDGENNCGKRKIAEAGELARQWGIKVYAIGVSNGERNFLRNFFGVQPFDSRELENLAAQTGGLFRLATDSKSLLEIYEEINKLERSRIDTVRFVDYSELFYWPAFSALLLLILKIILQATIFRKLP